MKIHVQTVLALAIFVPWFLATLAVQIHLVAGTLRHNSLPWLLFWKKWDLLQLCPRFTFFSWLPSTHYRLLVRDRYPGNKPEFTPWRLIVLPQRPPWRFLWNPPRRVRFAFEDASRALLAHLGGQVEQAGMYSYHCHAYELLAQYCLHLAAFPGAAQRQFMLVQQSTVRAEAPPEPLFISPPLDLPPPLDLDRRRLSFELLIIEKETLDAA